ncbi:MAG: hypothetical protein HZB56_05895 [Deltaproteobacteria bacterium]|nr:hypothetical protein [Deltaproteobacteria bacterium]
MLRVTQGVAGIRRWTEVRGGWPCRRLDGRLAVGFAGDICRGVEIGWAEFLATFCAQRAAFVLDDEPGSRSCFVGTPDEARRYVADMSGWVPQEASAPVAPVDSAILGPGEALAGRTARPSAGWIR